MAQATNTNAVNFEPASQEAVDANADATHVGLWTAETGGLFLWGAAIAGDPAALELGERYRIEPGVLVITQSAGPGETEAMAKRGIAGRIAGTLYVSVHSGDPGVTGENEITQISRASITAANWTVTPA